MTTRATDLKYSLIGFEQVKATIESGQADELFQFIHQGLYPKGYTVGLELKELFILVNELLKANKKKYVEIDWEYDE